MEKGAEQHLAYMKPLMIHAFVLFTMSTFAQVSTGDSVGRSAQPVFVYPDQMPEYPGGDRALLMDIAKNLIYPNSGECLTGRVVVSFWVNEDGTLSDFCVVKGLRSSFDEAAIAALKQLKPFIPGYRNGKASRTKMVFPVVFR